MPHLETILVAFNAIPVVFTAAAYLGRRWGRIGLLVVTAFGVLALPLLIVLGEEWRQEIDVGTVLYSVAGVGVVVLLMLPASGAWYRKAHLPAEA